jgi:hypothetical protein
MSPYQQPDDDDVSSDLSGSFLRQSDFSDGSGIVFTIATVEKKDFEAKNGRPAESKWVVTFVGGRCLGLNKTNLQLLAKWFGKLSRNWIGKRVTVYVDESVAFGGRLVGGLRVRRPSAQDVPSFVVDADDPGPPEEIAS